MLRKATNALLLPGVIGAGDIFNFLLIGIHGYGVRMRQHSVSRNSEICLPP